MLPFVRNAVSVLPASERSELDPACFCFVAPALHHMGPLYLKHMFFCKLNYICVVGMESSPSFSEQIIIIYGNAPITNRRGASDDVVANRSTIERHCIK